MKKILAALLAYMMLFSLAACGRNINSNEGNSSSQSGNTAGSENEISQTPEQNNNTNQTDSTNSSNSTKGGDEKEKMITMNIKVGNKTFTAKMYDNESTQALIAKLPMTVNMSELNGREKYYNLSSNLPAESTESPATIKAGDIMFWSSSNLVLFYNTFSNSYGGYVRLGYIEDISGLASALGTGSVQVTFFVSD
ncbi:cyclophilin-like fold protein [Clostridium sp.]|jgi:hypothetical protein|uniref:cyclophilin-like fold protein n=1 Tax=Clostridium sp. TaxID=1506 RepID=UPI00258D5348|nr:cyclophilin-like fold protein [Clostridium sp.]MDF2503559.1 hypothetical protein [Clostridium sp.]